jgi:DNA repair protein RecN (Recombination protein N)
LLVISHLPQVAGFADQHLRISKQVSGDRMRSVVELLDEEQRLVEIAVMLDGFPVTDASRAKADEMIRRMGASGDRGD